MIQLNKCDVLEAINGLFPENEVKAVRPVLLPSSGVKNDKNVCYFGNINGKTDLVLLYGGVVVEPVGSVLFNQFTGGFVMFSGYEITLKFSIPEIDVINNMPAIPTFDKVCCNSTPEQNDGEQLPQYFDLECFVYLDGEAYTGGVIAYRVGAMAGKGEDAENGWVLFTDQEAGKYEFDIYVNGERTDNPIIVENIDASNNTVELYFVSPQTGLA